MPCSYPQRNMGRHWNHKTNHRLPWKRSNHRKRYFLIIKEYDFQNEKFSRSTERCPCRNLPKSRAREKKVDNLRD